LIELCGVEQNRFHAHDVWQHTMECLDRCPARPMVRLAGLLHDIGKPEARAFSEKTNDYTFYDHEQRGAELADALLRRLRFSNTERAHVVHLVRHHLVVYDESWTDAAVRRWLRRVTPELAEEVLALSHADILAKGRDTKDELARVDALRERLEAVLAEGTALTVRDLAINGHDLHHELGVEPGPVMGTVLRALLDEVTDQPQINERAALLARARDLLA
jgi:tRNA nucleotidyltransferase (CCA-adding enzyme)